MDIFEPLPRCGIEFRSWPFTLLFYDFILQRASETRWRLNAAKAPMKPATVQEGFIPFRQLMNICSALVVLRSAVRWVQRRSQLIMSKSSGAARLLFTDRKEK